MSQIIVFAGPDCVGKSTQIEETSNYLRNLGKKVVSFSFPTYNDGPYSGLVKKYLNGELGDRKKLDPRFVALLYAGDRLECKPSLDACRDIYDYILMDRYVESTLVYQGLSVEADQLLEFRKWVKGIDYVVNRIPMPNLTFYLDLSTEELISRLAKKQQKDMHELDMPFMSKVISAYRHLATTEPHWTKIECTGKDVNSIQNQIRLTLQNQFSI